jgi:hypothetical protein
MKFSTENFETSPDIMQIEYTREQNAKEIWFDSSSIHGVPLIAENFQTMSSTRPSALFPGYTGAYCLPGGECESVYFSDDSEEGRPCPDSTSVTFIACSRSAMAAEILEAMTGSLCGIGLRVGRCMTLRFGHCVTRFQLGQSGGHQEYTRVIQTRQTAMMEHDTTRKHGMELNHDMTLPEFLVSFADIHARLSYLLPEIPHLPIPPSSTPSTRRPRNHQIQPRPQPIPGPRNLYPCHIDMRLVVTPIQIPAFNRAHAIDQHVTAHERIRLARPRQRAALRVIDVHAVEPAAGVPAKTAFFDGGRQARRELARYALRAAARQLFGDLRVPDVVL